MKINPEENNEKIYKDFVIEYREEDSWVVYPPYGDEYEFSSEIDAMEWIDCIRDEGIEFKEDPEFNFEYDYYVEENL